MKSKNQNDSLLLTLKVIINNTTYLFQQSLSEFRHAFISAIPTDGRFPYELFNPVQCLLWWLPVNHPLYARHKTFILQFSRKRATGAMYAPNQLKSVVQFKGLGKNMLRIIITQGEGQAQNLEELGEQNVHKHVKIRIAKCSVVS